MIYNSGKIYAKVWKVTPSEKYLDLQITTSEKDTEGEYRNSHWYPRLIGHAFNSLKGKVNIGDKIVISKSKFTNELVEDKQQGARKPYFRFLVFEAELENDTSTAPSEPEPETSSNAEDSPW